MTRKLTTNEFIARAVNVHGNQWDYSKTDYQGQLRLVEIGCAIHGPFLQLPEAHVRQRQGCPECGTVKSGLNRVCTQAHFLDKISTEYKTVYNLSSAVYKGLYTPVVVGCTEHGSFEIKPCDIYRGVGCLKCATYGFKSNKPASLYVLEASNGLVKLGITNREPSLRARRVSTLSGLDHKIVYSALFTEGWVAKSLESSLLDDLRCEYSNPPDTYDGYTESFVGLPTEVLIKKIESLRSKL